MNTRVHRPLKVVAFNANGIIRQRYELSKQLQARLRDVALLSKTHLKPHERFSIRNYHIYRNDRQPGAKRWNCGCSQKRSPTQLCRPTSPDFDRSHRGLHTQLVTKKYCLQWLINPRSGTGVTLTSRSS
jgi:hypothetical protein